MSNVELVHHVIAHAHADGKQHCEVHVDGGIKPTTVFVRKKNGN
jgi:pentose-5-phosphate-3-epimerase